MTNHRASSTKCPWLVVISLLTGLVASAAELPPECRVTNYSLARRDSDGKRYVPGEVIIQHKAKVANPKLAALIPGNTRLSPRFCILATGDCVYEYPSGCLGGDPETVASALKDNMYACAPGSPPPGPSMIEDVHPNAVLHLVVEDSLGDFADAAGDDRFYLQKQMQALGAEAAWLGSTPNKDIITAVLDSGVQLGHQDFKNDLSSIPFQLLVEGVTIPCNTSSCKGGFARNEGHGTSMAGNIGAASNGKGTIGVSWNTRILSMAITENGLTNDAVLSKALECAVYHEVSVINASFSDPTPVPETAKTMDSLSPTYLFVVSAGNSQEDLTVKPAFPAALKSPSTGQAFPNMIVVLSHEDDGSYDGISSWGVGVVDIAAPGRTYAPKICAGNDCWGRSSSGTSNAASYVSGAVALLWAKYPEWKYPDIKWRLLVNSDLERQLITKLYPPRRLNLERIMHPVSLINAAPDRTINAADTSDADSKRAFPVAMCTRVDGSLVKIVGTNENPVQSGDLQPGDRIRARANCVRAMKSAYTADSVIYTVK